MNPANNPDQTPSRTLSEIEIDVLAMKLARQLSGLSVKQASVVLGRCEFLIQVYTVFNPDSPEFVSVLNEANKLYGDSPE